jgi:hypothetical protein
MITILSGLELEVEISAFGIGGEEGGVLLSGHIEVLIDLSTLSKFQFQHLFLRSIADPGNAAGVYRNSLHTFLDADEPTKYQMRSLCFKFPRHLFAGSDAENAQRYRSCRMEGSVQFGLMDRPIRSGN